MKKTVVVIGSDTIPLSIIHENTNYSPLLHVPFASGLRSFKIAKELAAHFDVCLLVPDCFSEHLKKEDLSFLPFEVDTYNFRVALWNWSQELDRKLKKANFVITQTHSGAGLQNCAVLPSNVNLIVDGWRVLPLELTGELLTHSKISRKVFWKKAKIQHDEVITRANCVLVANERQFHYYEGLFYGIDKHNYNSFQFSPILKVPFGIESTRPHVSTPSSDLRLLWIGPMQPWDFPEIFIKEFSNYDDISITFVDIKNQEHPKVFNTYFRTYFDKLEHVANMTTSRISDIQLQDYDFLVHITRNWIISSYLHKVSALYSLASGLPVVTNSEDCLYEEFPFLRTNFYTTDNTILKSQIISLRDRKKDHIAQKSSLSLEELYNIFNWKNVLATLIDYIYNF